MSLELESVKAKKMREALIEKDEDSKLLDDLLKQQIEYFELKDENAELRKKIKRLEKENKKSNKQYSLLN